MDCSGPGAERRVTANDDRMQRLDAHWLSTLTIQFTAPPRAQLCNMSYSNTHTYSHSCHGAAKYFVCMHVQQRVCIFRHSTVRYLELLLSLHPRIVDLENLTLLPSRQHAQRLRGSHGFSVPLPLPLPLLSCPLCPNPHACQCSTWSSLPGTPSFPPSSPIPLFSCSASTATRLRRANVGGHGLDMGLWCDKWWWLTHMLFGALRQVSVLHRRRAPPLLIALFVLECQKGDTSGDQKMPVSSVIPPLHRTSLLVQ